MDDEVKDEAIMFTGPPMALGPGESPPRLSVCARIGRKAKVDKAAKRLDAARGQCAWCRHPIWICKSTAEVLAIADRVKNPIDAVCDDCAIKSGAADFLARQILAGTARQS